MTGGGEENPHERAADALHEVLLAMDEVDLNTLLDEDALALLEAKVTIEDMCLRHRQDQHAAEERRS